MAIPLNKTLVRTLIERRFGSIDELVVEWEERVASGTQKTGSPRDRSTIYRWIEKGLPSKRDDVFGFAGVLDVDPVGILDIDDALIHEGFAKERRSFQMGLARRTPLSPFWLIYLPGPAWPNEELAAGYYGRPWCVKDFVHDPSIISNVYAAVYMEATGDTDPVTPRIYHFAYRRMGARDDMWRPYGTVIGYQNEVRLISESGDYQTLSDDRSTNMVVAETYFGAEPAEFRIASLHNFTFCVKAPSDEQIAVRFVG